MVAANLGPAYDLSQRLSKIEADVRALLTQDPSGVTAADLAGNQTFGPDTAGFGLANPWIPLPPPINTNVATWPGTTSTTSVSISASNAYIQHPQIQLVAQGYAPAGVTGTFQLAINGTLVGTAWSASGGIATTTQEIAVPSPTWLGFVALQVFAQVTGGTGTVSAQVAALYGRQT